jgi:hypothetical protein
VTAAEIAANVAAEPGKTMLRRLAALVVVLCAMAPFRALAADQDVHIGQGGQALYGSLMRPETPRTGVAVLILAGSGAVDRNGDELRAGITAQNLKLIADGLAANGVISLRIDKRGVGESAPAAPSLPDLRLQTYVDDAVSWAGFLRAQPGVGCVVILGHSEGALIAAFAARKVETCGVVSISGAGRDFGAVIENQLLDQGAPAPALARVHAIIVSLRAGQAVADIPPPLLNLFRPGVQPYLMSEINIDPADALAKVRSPVLIVQGDNDLQVKVEDAQRLAAAQPRAQLVIIKGMNHMLKLAPPDRPGNLATYANPDLPLAPGVVSAIVALVDATPSRDHGVM